jgi:hypothetical protein
LSRGLRYFDGTITLARIIIGAGFDAVAKKVAV